MPKKSAGKAAAYDTDAESCAPFGFYANDILVTPLGATVTVLGVRPMGEEGNRLWAQYKGDFASPLPPKTFEEFANQGYKRAHASSYILREVQQLQEKMKEWQEEAAKKAAAAAGGGGETKENKDAKKKK